MKNIKTLWECLGKTVPAPYTRNLQIVYTPQMDPGMKDFTFLISTLYPVDGQTDYHIHPVDEMILILSGRGEAIMGEEKTTIEPGSVIYAPTGVRHQCKNYSDESMRMACFYIPALPDDAVNKIMEGATLRVPKESA